MKLNYYSESNDVQITEKGRRVIEISSSKQGEYTVVIEAMYRGSKIAFISVTVTADHFRSVELQSIEEPVVGANFRIQPRFKIGSSDLEDSSCDFNYKWSSANGYIRLG